MAQKKTEAVRLAEIQAQKDLIDSIINNPMVIFVAGVTLLEFFERRGWGGAIMTPASQGALGSVCVARALAPLVKELAGGGSNVGAEIIKKLI